MLIVCELDPDVCELAVIYWFFSSVKVRYLGNGKSTNVVGQVYKQVQ